MAGKQLNQYKGVFGKFVCNVCRISKASTLGFYAHVLVCGKTEEVSSKALLYDEFINTNIDNDCI